MPNISPLATKILNAKSSVTIVSLQNKLQFLTTTHFLFKSKRHNSQKSSVWNQVLTWTVFSNKLTLLKWNINFIYASLKTKRAETKIFTIFPKFKRFNLVKNQWTGTEFEHVLYYLVINLHMKYQIIYTSLQN